MLFVELGREVSPLNLKHRHHKAVITGIKDSKFVVILKQDNTHEVIRLKDIVLNEKVYNLEELKDTNHEFFKKQEATEKSSDFTRFVLRLRNSIVEDVIKSKMAKN